MNLDERLEAITMNLELTSRDVADLQKAVAGMQKGMADLQKGMTDMQKGMTDMQRYMLDFQQATAARFAQWEMEKTHLDEKVDSLVVSTQMLLTAVQAQQTRIERLEGR